MTHDEHTETRREASPPPSKIELIAALRENGDRFLERLRAMPADGFDTGRYENGWSARQILAHVAAVEWTYARLIDVAGEAASDHAVAPGGEPASRPTGGGMDAYNARQAEKRANATVPELLDEFARNRARTIAAVESAPASLLAAPITTAGGINGPLATALHAVAIDHVNQHLTDITRH